MAFFLAAITARLLSRILGALDAPFGAIMAKRGEAGTGTAAAGGRSDGGGNPSVGSTMAAASASATPRRCRQLRQGPGRGIPQRAQRRPQDHQEGMNPLMGFALAHPEQPPLHHLEGIGLR